MTEPLGGNRTFLLCYSLGRVPWTHNMETSIRFLWLISQLSDPRDLDLSLNLGKKILCITHRPIPTYQVSFRSDEKKYERTDVRFYKVISHRRRPKNQTCGVDAHSDTVIFLLKSNTLWMQSFIIRVFPSSPWRQMHVRLEVAIHLHFTLVSFSSCTEHS